ncbi:MAG TPA: hypothetical protein VNZ49_09560 [Bacteroidia bacterium]|nr:hypothetical protein [Bacteroidia bacterium]
MPNNTFELNYLLKGDPLNYYSAVLDMRIFGHHHPYMREVKVLQNTPEFTEYNIKEMVWIFGFIPQWPDYNAKVFELNKNKHIQYTSAVKKGLDLSIDFVFSDNVNRTTGITENIKLTGNKIVSKILLETIKKSHTVLFKNLEAGLNK